MDREIELPVAVIVERRPARSGWLDWIWRAVDVLDGAPAAAPFTLLDEGADGTARYLAGSVTVRLHRTDSASYRDNLAGDRAVYVVLRKGGEGPAPFRLHAVLASPDEAQSVLSAGEDEVEKLPMPPRLAAAMAEFSAAHFREEPFVKRRRDPVRPEERQFGKEPIFAPGRRPPRGGNGDGR